jgi:hypothetical protein
MMTTLRWSSNQEGRRKKERKQVTREDRETERHAPRDRPSSYSQDSRNKTKKQSKTECHKRDYKEEANIELYSSHSLEFTLKSGIEKILQNRKKTHTHEKTKTNQKNFFRKPADINNFPSSLETTQIERKEKEKKKTKKTKSLCDTRSFSSSSFLDAAAWNQRYCH